MRRLAVILPLLSLAIAVCTLAWACLPDPPAPDRIVIVPAAPVKSLVEWWEIEANTAEGQLYFEHPEKRPLFTPRAYYVVSVAHGNLVMRRNSTIKGGQQWGPQAREDNAYRVCHRANYGGDWGLTIRVELHSGTLQEAKADLERCEGRPITVELNSDNPQSSTLPNVDAAGTAR